jgi:hypothetical protein
MQVGSDAHPVVGDLQLQFHPVGAAGQLFDADADVALGGELDGVVKQV